MMNKGVKLLKIEAQGNQSLRTNYVESNSQPVQFMILFGYCEERLLVLTEKSVCRMKGGKEEVCRMRKQ